MLSKMFTEGYKKGYVDALNYVALLMDEVLVDNIAEYNGFADYIVNQRPLYGTIRDYHYIAAYGQVLKKLKKKILEAIANSEF